MNMEKPHGALATRQPHLRLLPSFLFDTEQPKTVYVLKAWLLCLLPSMALGAIVTGLAPGAPTPEFGGTGIAVYLMVALFAPVVETFILVPPLLLMRRFLGDTAAVVGSALLWGLLHSSAVPIWGLIIWWPFLIFSTIILAWRCQSLATGMVLVIAVHALQNGVAGIGLLVG